MGSEAVSSTCARPVLVNPPPQPDMTIRLVNRQRLAHHESLTFTRCNWHLSSGMLAPLQLACGEARGQSLTGKLRLARRGHIFNNNNNNDANTGFMLHDFLISSMKVLQYTLSAEFPLFGTHPLFVSIFSFFPPLFSLCLYSSTALKADNTELFFFISLDHSFKLKSTRTFTDYYTHF